MAASRGVYWAGQCAGSGQGLMCHSCPAGVTSGVVLACVAFMVSHNLGLMTSQGSPLVM